MLRRLDPVFLLLLVAALAVRLFLASTVDLVHDEVNTSIPLSRLISFDPEHPYLPIRAVNHGALPAYVVKASSAVAGTTLLGYRAGHVVLGLCVLGLVYALARQAFGVATARWAALFVGFNGYFLDVSSRATAHTPFLFFVAVALHAFTRFLRDERPVHLYATAAATGLAFYCKEHAVLLGVAIGVMLCQPRYRTWLSRPAPYVAAGIFVLFIAPDLVWNATATPEAARVTYGERDAPQATYSRHLERIGGIGLSVYPLAFYGRSAVAAGYTAVTGKEFDDNTREYRSIHPALGALLLLTTAVTLYGFRTTDVVTQFLALYFVVVFGLFTLIRPGNPEGLDAVSWIWVEASLLPATVLAGVQIGRLRGYRKVTVAALAVAAVAAGLATTWETLVRT